MSSLFDVLAQHATQKPDHVALCGDGVTLTYGTLTQAISEKIDLLTQYDIKVLGLQLSNSVEWILWDLAALKAGIVCVPMPPFFTPPQVAHVIASAGIDTCITKHGLVLTHPGTTAIIPPSTAKITFTSGTTGTSKGVCLSGSSMAQLPQSLLSVIGSEYGERHLSVMPLAILLENVAGVYTALMAGAEVYIPVSTEIGMGNPFQPDFMKLAEFIAQHRITSIILTPELLRGFMYAAHANIHLCASLRFIAVGGATVPPALLRVARAAGLPVYEGYGLSECASVVALNTPDADYSGTVGNILPHVKVAIRDGEVVIENPAFLGYLGEPARNPMDTFATGDNGAIEANGALSISGRRKNTIITSQGRNIAPEWVEALLLSQPEIAQAFVYGDDLPFPQALLVPTHAAAALADAVARVNLELPVYAQLVHFDMVQPFTPHNGMLTATGRLRRKPIADTYQSLIKKGTDHAILRHVS